MPTYTPKPSVVTTDLMDEAVLLDLDTRAYFSLNETGTRVWEALAAGRTDAEAAGALVDEWNVTPDEAAATVRTFVDDLVQNGLLVPVAPP